MPIAQQSYTYRDAKGYTWTLKHYIHYLNDTSAHLADARTVGSVVQGALSGTGAGTLALTNGALWRVHGPYDEADFALSYGTAAQYLNAEDKLMVAFYDSGGSIHRFGIGSPVTAAFLADQETGKASQLVDFVNAMTTAQGSAQACTKGGLFFSSAVGSVLVRRRQRRKVFLTSKSSNLDEPGE
jgi:hypothetical protein